MAIGIGYNYDVSRHLCEFVQENSAAIWGSIDASSRFVAEGVNDFLKSLREEMTFSDDSVGKTLKQALEKTNSSPTSEDDTTAQAVKKLGFSLFVSIPMTFFIKDIASNAQLDLKKANSISEATGMVANTYIYANASLLVLNMLVAVADSCNPAIDQAKAAPNTKEAEVEPEAAPAA